MKYTFLDLIQDQEKLITLFTEFDQFLATESEKFHLPKEKIQELIKIALT